eukprot:2253957-Amphidinium_carterae.1
MTIFQLACKTPHVWPTVPSVCIASTKPYSSTSLRGLTLTNTNYLFAIRISSRRLEQCPPIGHADCLPSAATQMLRLHLSLGVSSRTFPPPLSAPQIRGQRSEALRRRVARMFCLDSVLRESRVNLLTDTSWAS